MAEYEEALTRMTDLQRNMREQQEVYQELNRILHTGDFDGAQQLANDLLALQGAPEARALTLEEWHTLDEDPTRQDNRFRPLTLGGPEGRAPFADPLGLIRRARETARAPDAPQRPREEGAAQEDRQEAEVVEDENARGDRAQALRNAPLQAPGQAQHERVPPPPHRRDQGRQHQQVAMDFLERFGDWLGRGNEAGANALPQVRNLGDLGFRGRDHFNQYAARLRDGPQQPRRPASLPPRRDDHLDPMHRWQPEGRLYDVRGPRYAAAGGGDRFSDDLGPGPYGQDDPVFGDPHAQRRYERGRERGRQDGLDFARPYRHAGPKIPISQFSDTGAAQWREWRITFTDWVECMWLSHLDAKLKLKALIVGDARQVASDVSFHAYNDHVSLHDVLEQLDECFMSKSSEGVSRAEFQGARQSASDNVAAWYGKLRRLHELGWPRLTQAERNRDSDLMLKFISGLKDSNLRRIMSEKPIDTYDKLKKETMMIEANMMTTSLQVRKSLNSLDPGPHAVEAIVPSTSSRACHVCSEDGHMWRQCPMTLKVTTLLKTPAAPARRPMGVAPYQGTFKKYGAPPTGRGRGRGGPIRGRQPFRGRGGFRPRAGVHSIQEGAIEGVNSMEAEDDPYEGEECETGWEEEDWGNEEAEETSQDQGN